MKLSLLALFIAVSSSAFAAVPCTVITGFNWIPNDYLDTPFLNPSAICAAKLAAAIPNATSATIHIPANRKNPLDLNLFINQLRENHPGCTVIGLGFIEFKSPENGSVNIAHHSSHFPANLKVRAEISGYNKISEIGDLKLDSSVPVDPDGKKRVTDRAWLKAMRKCTLASSHANVGMGHDHDAGTNACNQQTYLLTEKKLGGFFHIADCSNETLDALKETVLCLRENFTPEDAL